MLFRARVCCRSLTALFCSGCRLELMYMHPSMEILRMRYLHVQLAGRFSGYAFIAPARHVERGSRVECVVLCNGWLVVRLLCSPSSRLTLLRFASPRVPMKWNGEWSECVSCPTISLPPSLAGLPACLQCWLPFSLSRNPLLHSSIVHPWNLPPLAVYLLRHIAPTHPCGGNPSFLRPSSLGYGFPASSAPS